MDPPHEDDAAAPPDPTAALHPEPPQASPSVSPTRIPKKTTQPVEGIPGLSPPVPLSQNGNRSNSFDGEKTTQPVEGIPGLSPPVPLSQNGIRSNSFDGGANEDSLCLPDGIQLPPTVTPGMIDGRLRRAFFDLTPSQMREVLTEFDDAVRDKGGEIRNHTAYLFGVVKRYKTTYGDTNPIPQGSLSDKVLVSNCHLPLDSTTTLKSSNDSMPMLPKLLDCFARTFHRCGWTHSLRVGSVPPMILT
jgi:hypothetical protein